MNPNNFFETTMARIDALSVSLTDAGYENFVLMSMENDTVVVSAEIDGRAVQLDYIVKSLENEEFILNISTGIEAGMLDVGMMTKCQIFNTHSITATATYSMADSQVIIKSSQPEKGRVTDSETLKLVVKLLVQSAEQFEALKIA